MTPPEATCGRLPPGGAASGPAKPVPRRPLGGVAALAAAALLSACSLIPTYERPPAPVAAAFPDAGSASGTAAADLAWSEFLADARIRALVEIALQNNRDLRVAVLNVEQTRALYGVQRADQLPTVNVGVTGNRQPNGSGGIASVYSAGVFVSAFEIDLFGRVRSLSEAAFARYVASDEGRRAAQMALIAAVANVELAIRADAELVEITQRTLDSRLQGLKLARVRFDAGVSAEPELRGAESLVAAARGNLIAFQRQRTLDQNALVQLIGQPLPASLPPAPPLAELKFAELPAGLPSDVLLQRPDVRQAEQLLIASNANIGAARAAFFPRISLTASAGFASNHLSGLFDNTAWTFAPQLMQPLFDYGRNRSTLEATEASRAIAVAQYEKAIQVAFREVADALAGRATLGDQLAEQQAQAAAANRLLELAALLYSGGAASLLDRLDAERSALLARQGVVLLALQQAQNQVLLYRVLGGGAGPVMVAATK